MTAALCPHNHDPSSGCGWCLWYDAMNISSNLTWWFHLLPTTPSDRRLGDFEIAMKQSRYDMMKDSSIEIRFGSKICLLSLMFVCCVLCRWSCSTMTVPAPTWFWYSPACTSFIEMESQWLGWRSCSGASAAWSGPRLGTSRSSTSPSRSPSTRCSYAYLVEFRNFYINIDNIRRRHLLNIHNMQRRCLLKNPFVSFTLPFQIVDYVREI